MTHEVSNRGNIPEPWLADADVTLYHGEVLAVLPELPAESVDCVVTSPPYWGLRDYGTGAWEGGDAECGHQEVQPQNREGRETPGGRGGTFPTSERSYKHVCGKCGATRIDQQLGLEPTPEQYVERMVEVFREVRRVLAPHGTVWLNLGDSYAANRSYQVSDNKHKAHDFAESNAMAVPAGLKPKDLIGVPWRVAFALQADGWYLRSDIIWAKPNPMPESVTDRPTKAHEYVFLLSKQPRYFFDQEAVREPSDPAYVLHRERYNGVAPIAPKKLGNSDRNDADRNPQGGFAPPSPAGRNIRSVWEIATQPYPEAHFATFPEELARRCIAAGSPANGVILDPFVGSGTVCHVARKLGRRSIGIDLNESYLELAARRLQQQSLFAEAVSGL